MKNVPNSRPNLDKAIQRFAEQPVLADKTLYGISDKIGTLETRGSLRAYETFDNTAERVDIKLTGFEYGFMIKNPENLCKLVIE